MSKVNPKYPLRDGLVCEFAMRSVNVEGDVQLLIKVFISVLAEDVSILLENAAG